MSRHILVNALAFGHQHLETVQSLHVCMQTWMRRESDLVQALAQAYAEREVLEASIRAAAEVHTSYLAAEPCGLQSTLNFMQHAAQLCSSCSDPA